MALQFVITVLQRIVMSDKMAEATDELLDYQGDGVLSPNDNVDLTIMEDEL